MMKKLMIKYLTMGVGWGSFLFVVHLIIYDLTEIVFLPNVFIDNIGLSALGFLALSVAFISTSIVYEIEQLRFGLKLLIHITVGLGTLLIIGFVIGLFTADNWLEITINIIINLIILLIVWVRYYIRDKNEVQQINEKLQEQNLKSSFDI